MGFTKVSTSDLSLSKIDGGIVAHKSRKTSTLTSTTRRAANFNVILFYFPKQDVAYVTPLTRRATNFRVMKGG